MHTLLSFLSYCKSQFVPFLFLGFLLLTTRTEGQTDFAPGEIMFTGYKSDDADAFSFVILAPVVSGTIIYITDRGWSNTTGYRTDNNGEGTISFTFTADYPCGTEFFFNDVGGANDWAATNAYGIGVGTVVIQASGQDPDGMELGVNGLNSTGDQLSIYQLPEPTSGNQGSFVCMIQMDNNINGAVDTDEESELPTGLPVDAIVRFNNEYDNAKYDCTPYTATSSALKAAITNDNGAGGLKSDASNNWMEADANTITPSPCFFCCGNVPPAAAPVLDAPFVVSTNSIFTISITGTLAPGASWQLYTAGCGVGTPLQTTMSNSFMVTAIGTEGFTTYYVKSSLTTDCSGICGTITIGTCINANNMNLCTDCNANMQTCGNCLLPYPANNPDLDSGCYALKLIFVLDESGSIGSNAVDVKNGVLAFLNALNGQNAQAALIEFSTTATLVNDYTVINQTYINNITNYFNPAVGYLGHSYSPNGGTNWHDAMIKADALAISDLVLFFTDGEPTVWSPTSNTTSDCGNGGSTQPPEIVNPVKIANKMKGEGTHMFMLGVGNNVNALNLERMSGFTVYESGINTMGTSDYSIGNFASLALDLQNFVLELCRSTMILIKDVLGPICNGMVQFRFRVINTGVQSSVTSVFVQDTFPAGYTSITYTGPQIKYCSGSGCIPAVPTNTFIWVPFSVDPGDTATLILSVGVTPGNYATGPYTNIGWVFAENADAASDTFPGNLLTEDSPPTIVCPVNVTIQCSASTLPANTGTASGFDPDGPLPTLTYTDVTSNGSCPQANIITRTWKATDACGNFVTCTQVINQIDTTPPSVGCPPNVTVDCAASTLPANTGNANPTDLCDPSPTLTHTDVIVPGACPSNYTVIRTWSATDHCGNNSTCLQTILVHDITPPQFTCVDKQILCSESILPSNPNLGTPVATNNCGGTSTATYTDVFVYAVSPPCSLIRTWTITDNCGNSATCNQLIIIKDQSIPVIFCPVNVSIACTASTLPGNTGTATATDNCSIFPGISYADAITVSPTCIQNYSIARTWKATDECGNSAYCTQSITVMDNVVPTITCPVNVTIACTASTLPASTGTATAVDNCSTLAITSTDVVVTGPCPQELIITRKWKAQDACGNSSTCNQIITVHDTSPPSMSCPPNVTVQCTASTLPANTGTATATDNCSTFGITSTDVIVTGICPQEKTITRTWKATDACGNFNTCNQIITVDDSSPPTVSCPINVTIDCAASTLPANTGIASATDNCSTFDVTSTDVIVTGICPQEKTITRTWKATDACGNFSTCNQVITIHDSTPPSMTCPSNVTIECTANTLPANTGTSTATDNCSTLAVTFTDVTVAGGCPQERIITRTWKATDACSNFSTCMQTITVDDSTPPSVSCPPNITIECTASTLPATTGTATATDNCSTITITSTDAILPGDCPQEKTIIRNWKATDACGNISSCNQTITVDDSTHPLMTCPMNVTIECTASTLPANTGSATATDNCSTFAITSTDVVTSGACPQEKTITRTWKATDACGNTTTCNQIIVVDDSTPPLISCPSDVTVQCISSTLPTETGSATSTDNCDVAPVVTYSDVTMNGPTLHGYSIIRTWTGTDACGNNSTCIQHLQIDNPLDPSITGLPTDTICSGDIEVFQAQNQGLGNVTYQWNFGSGASPATASGIGPHSVTYTYNGTNGTTGAWVLLTVSFPGCASVTDTVSNIHVNPIPNAAIMAAIDPLCYFRFRTFKPVAPQVPGYYYHWDFDSGASLPPQTGYGPYNVKYSTTGTKTVQLIVFANEPGASCGDTTTITFSVITCLGSVTGKVIDTLNVGIQSSNVRLFVDNNFDGLPDPNLGSVKSVNTVASGVFSMASVIPGNYVIVQTQPVGYISKSDKDITNDMDSVVNINLNDNIIPATVEAQENDADNIFTEKKVDGIVSGYVFTDLDNDLIVDNGEGLGGVTITLYNDINHNGIPVAGNVINTKQTSILGYYEFGNLPNGDYILVETEPSGYISAMDIDISDDNDVVPNTNMTDDIIPFTITLAETDIDNYFTEIQVCGQMVTNTNDNGPGSLRYVLDCADPGDTILFAASLQNQTIHLNTSRIEINRNIYIYSNLTPRVKIQSDISGAFLIDAGFTAEFKNIDFISGLSGYSGAAFENHGNLILWDATINKNALLLPNNPLIYNIGAAAMTVKGGIMIDNQ